MASDDHVVRSRSPAISRVLAAAVLSGGLAPLAASLHVMTPLHLARSRARARRVWGCGLWRGLRRLHQSCIAYVVLRCVDVCVAWGSLQPAPRSRLPAPGSASASRTLARSRLWTVWSVFSIHIGIPRGESGFESGS